MRSLRGVLGQWRADSVGRSNPCPRRLTYCVTPISTIAPTLVPVPATADPAASIEIVAYPSSAPSGAIRRPDYGRRGALHLRSFARGARPMEGSLRWALKPTPTAFNPSLNPRTPHSVFPTVATPQQRREKRKKGACGINNNTCLRCHLPAPYPILCMKAHCTTLCREPRVFNHSLPVSVIDVSSLA
jgi:hypothetical protein